MLLLFSKLIKKVKIMKHTIDDYFKEIKIIGKETKENIKEFNKEVNTKENWKKVYEFGGNVLNGYIRGITSPFRIPSGLVNGYKFGDTHSFNDINIEKFSSAMIGIYSFSFIPNIINEYMIDNLGFGFGKAILISNGLSLLYEISKSSKKAIDERIQKRKYNSHI